MRKKKQQQTMFSHSLCLRKWSFVLIIAYFEYSLISLLVLFSLKLQIAIFTITDCFILI